jgi:hypothetical protein
MKYNAKRTIGASLVAAVFMGGAVLAPVTANAQDWQDAHNHRQQTKNTWRNVAIGSGVLGVLGFATHNNTLGIAGAAGALYSASRYDHDRRSENRIDRQRANYYGRTDFNYGGHHYHRKTVYRNGQKYYQFVRS